MVKVTLIMMDHKIISYFNQFKKLLQLFLVFHTQYQNANLKTLPNKKLELLYTTNRCLSPKMIWEQNYSRLRLEFKRSRLKHDNKSFTPNNVINVFIVYVLERWSKY